MSTKPPSTCLPLSPSPGAAQHGCTNASPFSPSAQKGESVKKMREEVSPGAGRVWGERWGESDGAAAAWALKGICRQSGASGTGSRWEPRARGMLGGVGRAGQEAEEAKMAARSRAEGGFITGGESRLLHVEPSWVVNPPLLFRGQSCGGQEL